MAQDTRALVQQHKAKTIKSYLFGDNMKRQLEMAVPKWLSVDRLLRVAFSSVLQNPQLLDCTPDSIMGALIRCAQVGLEPVMGRAYLVPYRNNRKPGKPMECQFQAGYQGLVDLGRRSGEIKDVKAHVVYEKDQFEIEYGDNERLYHKPNWTAPDREAPIGAYAVWVYKDGYKSTTFMPIRDIYAIRDRSQAWQAHKKYGYDCPWTTDEGEMIKKTVIKRSAKLAPASIEFMQAVELDNQAEFGTTPSLGAGLDLQALEEGKGPTSEELTTAFNSAILPLAQKHGISANQVDEFLAMASDHYGQAIDEVKAAALDDSDEFISGLIRWAQKDAPAGNAQATAPEHKLQDPPVKPQPEPVMEAEVVNGDSEQPEDPRRAEYINLRSSGFSTWVWKHYHRIHSDQFTDVHREEIRAKWAKLYPDQPFPSRDNETVQKAAAANGNGNGNGGYVFCNRAGQRKPLQVCEQKCSYTTTCEDYLKHSTNAANPAASSMIPCPNYDGRDVPLEKCSECSMREGCPSVA